MKIILMGIQGSGKSTQGNLLSKKLNLPYLSTGHIFRDMSKEKSRLGRYLKETMNAGFLVSDRKTVVIVEEYLSRPEYKTGFILDGFPRTLYQAKKFNHQIDKIFYLKVSDKEALWRLSYRNDVMREDETLKAIRKRIELFHKFAEPVFTYYRRRQLLTEVNGEKPIKEVNQEIVKYLKK